MLQRRWQTIRPEDIEIVSEAATNTVAGTVAVRTF